MSKHRIAVIAGDGIGKEVMPEGLRVLDAAARRFGIGLQLDHFDFASCDHHARHGQMMPPDWKAQLQGMDAILFGAVGWPATVPDHISLWGSLLKFRREFDQYINLRPVRLFEGVDLGALHLLAFPYEARGDEELHLVNLSPLGDLGQLVLNEV